MNVKEIGYVETYRDGGSIGMAFRAKPKGIFSRSKWYELFIKNRSFEEKPDTDYYEPKIYLEDCNSGKIIKELTWEDANIFVSKLSNSHENFQTLVQLIKSHGKST